MLSVTLAISVDYAIIACKYRNKVGALLPMGKPKKRTSSRRTGTRRSHLTLELARKVNATSPVKVRTTSRESAKVEKAA
jgi:ribosomal protein L32